MRWLMSFNVEKCHRLYVIKNRNRIPISYILPNQTLERVGSTKHRGVELAESRHRGETHPVNCCKIKQSECLCIQGPEGIPSCCPHTPVLEYASMAWDPPQQHLKSTLVMVQRRSARRILHDFSPTSSASALVAQLQLENLQSGRTSDKPQGLHGVQNY